MTRDIDDLIARLGAEMPGARVKQRPVEAGDGRWFIKVRSKRGEVQLASPDGQCPFVIESDFNDDVVQARSVDEVVSIVRALFA